MKIVSKLQSSIKLKGYEKEILKFFTLYGRKTVILKREYSNDLATIELKLTNYKKDPFAIDHIYHDFCTRLNRKGIIKTKFTSKGTVVITIPN
jgi:hypothetical protein